MILSSSFEPLPIPRDVSVTDFVFSNAVKFGDRVAIVNGETHQTYTFRDSYNIIRTLKLGLRQLGVKSKDVVLFYSTNSPEFIFAFHAVLSLGATSSLANPIYTVEELSHQLTDSGSRFVLTTSNSVARVQEAIQHAGKQDLIPTSSIFVVGGSTEDEAGFRAAGMHCYADVVRAGQDLLQESGAGEVVDEKHSLCADVPDLDPTSTIACLPYSSGTTGLPKGVCLSHYNLVANIYQSSVDAISPCSHNDILLGVLPFFHIYGLTAIVNLGLMVGAKIITMNKFEPARYLQLIQQYQVTRLHVVPPIVNFLAKHPVVSQFNLSSVVELFSGAAPLGADLSQAVQQRLPHLACVRQGYGMTELSPACHICPVQGNTPGSIGVLLPNTECKLLDVATGQLVDPASGQRGEICVRGPQVMMGYLNNEEATRHTIDEEGFLHTGDVGYVNPQGHFFIVDRIKELIKVKGFQVAPAELEDVLLSHSDIGDAAVLGLPYRQLDRASVAETDVAHSDGEAVIAFVVRKRADLTEAEVQQFVAERVAVYKQVHVVVFVESVPKSASGKILRRVLKEQAKSMSLTISLKKE